MKIIPYSVNVMDEHGAIIASGEPSRLRQRHDCLLYTSKKKKELIVKEMRIIQMNGS
ncbi:carbohydrate diacid regulator, partial [Staphylococcus aureus]|nr:carbohydrate diacid regulator [Staphylococcus aureus]